MGRKKTEHYIWSMYGGGRIYSNSFDALSFSAFAIFSIFTIVVYMRRVGGTEDFGWNAISDRES